MPEFLTLLAPAEARSLLLSNLSATEPDDELVPAFSALGRVTAENIVAPHPLPEFPRSTVDGYAVRAADTFGASESLPAYLNLIAEVPMGDRPAFELQSGDCALVHTGGMLPSGASAAVMLEYTQAISRSDHRQGKAAADARGEIEIFRPVAEGENVISVGEDVAQGDVMLPKGHWMGPAEIGALMAVGITSLRVAKRPKIGLISSGDEVIEPGSRPQPGQVRDVNSYTLGALVEKSGGEARMYGIVPDRLEALQAGAASALAECDAVVITAGSSASARDITSKVIATLGQPGVLVHGINTRPGKPTILGACAGKAVVGLPGNPVSALVNGYLFVVPVIEQLLGASPRARASVTARLTVNLGSVAGREDWWPVKLNGQLAEHSEQVRWMAEPIFGKSNSIVTFAAADGMLCITADETGIEAGELVEVRLI